MSVGLYRFEKSLAHLGTLIVYINSTLLKLFTLKFCNFSVHLNNISYSLFSKINALQNIVLYKSSLGIPHCVRNKRLAKSTCRQGEI
jgi:hypothetical protein